jgi:regulator of cell morphogenesis and NO signaling
MNVMETNTVRELALQVPGATRVFENLGIDYCCGGQKPLTEACAAAKVPVQDVLARLAEVQKDPTPANDRHYQDTTMSALIDHIVEKHHAFVRAEVPRLENLIAKVVSAHGANHPELNQVQQTFSDLGHELSMHLMKEEQILFPYIADMEDAATNDAKAPASCFGTVQNPIRMMLMEHDSAGNALRTLRQVTNDYAVPADACISYKTLYQALQEFEADLHQHIHLENNILFPRALEVEAAA